jgi:hypothetical protein
MLQKELSFLSKEQFEANKALKSVIKLRELSHGRGRGAGKGQKKFHVLSEWPLRTLKQDSKYFNQQCTF